jgi:hypothetical protein
VIDKGIGIIMAILFLTGLALVLSKKSQTSGVLNAFFKGIGALQKNAISPVTAK